MVWVVKWTKEAEESLTKLGKLLERKIRTRVDNILAKNPKGNNCEPLEGDLKGLWRYLSLLWQISSCLQNIPSQNSS